MDSRKPPAVYTTVTYDTARKTWVPHVKLMQDGKEISADCCGKRLCVMKGEDCVEIDGEKVSDEKLEEMKESYDQIEEHLERVRDLKEIADNLVTSFFVDESEDSEKDGEDSEKDDDEKDEEDGERTGKVKGSSAPNCQKGAAPADGQAATADPPADKKPPSPASRMRRMASRRK